jgi:peptidyl-prolyl cis-trans isomerase B (cyclophilin B)
VRRGLLAPICLLALGFSSCGDGNGGSSGTVSEKPPPAPTGGCARVHRPKPKPDGGQQPPQQSLDVSRRYVVTLKTSCGDLSIALNVKGSPRTTASFVSLVRAGFYDGTLFHRIVPGFVIQGGDPTGTGNGGPGYSTRDVPPRDTRYIRGVVAMAKTAEEPSGTAGSQFYVVSARDAALPAEYALLGRVVGGSRVAARIDRLGDPSSGEVGTPTRAVVLEKASVSRR